MRRTKTVPDLAVGEIVELNQHKYVATVRDPGDCDPCAGCVALRDGILCEALPWCVDRTGSDLDIVFNAV